MTRLRILRNETAVRPDDPGSTPSLSTQTHPGEGRTATHPLAPVRWISLCAWCPGARSETHRWEFRGYSVTHTICAECKRKMLDNLDAWGAGCDE